MSHAPSLKHGKLECSGSGFTFCSHHREDSSSIAMEVGLQPRLTPSGRISKRQTVDKRPKSWWEAQVRLYGLKCSDWTINGMRAVLTAALQEGLEVPDDLSRLETNFNEEYRADDARFQARAAQARDRKWAALPSDVAKVDHDPERFLQQLRSDGGVKALRGLFHRAQFHSIAQRMGLFSQSTDGVGGGYDDRILVVGKDRDEVRREINRISTGVHAQLRADEVAQQIEIDQRHRNLVKRGDGGDIGGTWQLDMPELSRIYQSGDVRLIIASPDDSGYVWASFDLVILEGVVRIDWAGPRSGWKGKERKFRWKGTETGEGVIQYEKSNGGTVTFTSASTCSGTWWGSYGTFEFTGKKISREMPASVDHLEDEFESYNEGAYEVARVSRWR
jgi:hypothetical protein